MASEHEDDDFVVHADDDAVAVGCPIEATLTWCDPAGLPPLVELRPAAVR
jgi:hypothetical protein